MTNSEGDERWRSSGEGDGRGEQEGGVWTIYKKENRGLG